MNCLLQWARHFAFSPAVKESSCCPTALPALGGVGVLNLGHSAVTLHCCSNVQFPKDKWPFFHVIIYLLCIFFGEVSVRVFSPLSYCWVLSILVCFENKSSIRNVFANIFSHSLAYLLTILIVSFTEQKILILMKFKLPTFSVMSHVFGVISKTHYQASNDLKYIPLCNHDTTALQQGMLHPFL